MKKSFLTSVIAMIAITLSGCSSTTGPSSSTSLTSTTSLSSATGNSDEIVGFGATLDVWNAHHIAHTGATLIPGCCYNPDPNLKSWGASDRYTDVVESGGIVTAYSLNLPEGTSLNDAKVAALAELPKDAKISFLNIQDTAATLEATSALLKPRLNDPNVVSSNGSVDFVFCSVARDGTYGFDKANANFVLVRPGMGLDVAKSANC